jgi:purine-cytosine permease-like protein
MSTETQSTPASVHTRTKSTLIERLDALYEYDREPVDENKLQGWWTFIAMFSSEHISGTEFVLGTLLVMHGVTAVDVFGGLALGNLLAVLSWAFMCAPIAVKERLTIYWQIRKIAGPYLTILYSGLFALILCLLAGSMVNVSTTAVTLPLHIPSPNYAAGQTVPSISWILIAIGVGTAIAVLAVLGFERLAHFAKVVAPWMPFVFLAGAISSLPSLGVTGLDNFWQIANEKIWTGAAYPGQMQYGFWHCVGLAWLCNIAQHMGMGDVTIFRYARKWQMGFCSAFGMFIGHYLAWICSGVLCAAYVHAQTAAGVADPNPTPGNIAMFGAGYAGIVCVLLAGWTTANPTLYRAGLAFQVATPNWRRWLVTLVAGILMIITACIPAVLHYLDRIVAYYGLFFMPLGAFVFIDFWLFPRLGLARNYAERRGLLISWPAAVGWFGSFGICFLLYAKDRYTSMAWINKHLPLFLSHYKADLFLQVLPAWLIAVILYTLCSVIQQRFNPISQEQTK